LANQITDNRTQVADADNTTDGILGTWTGSTSVVQDTDVKIEGTGSIAESFTNSIRTILWNRGSTFSLANTHVYIWVNCGVVGLLLAKASGGMAVRFCGPSTADFFEVYVGGNDSWPNAVAGGWVQFVVDVVAAQASPSNTGGTPPAITAIQHIGIAGVTSTMTKVADNTWCDAIYTLADGVPGIIVEGRNGGTTPWNTADILTQLGASSGAIKQGPGGSYVFNTPIQFGINDTSTHEFTDTNSIWLWDNQEFAAADLYGISALGNTGGTTNVIFGAKTGTGDDAIGSQGLTIAAASSGVRWFMDFDDPDLDLVGLYGCSFQHGATFQLDDPAVSVISSLYIDCQQAVISNSEQLRVSVINAATADGTAFMVTDDMSDIVFSSFQFSDGHAIELNAATPTSQTNKGNLFSGYTNTINSTDAAILNSAAGAIAISSTDASNLNVNSYRNTGGGSVTITAAVTVELTIIDSITKVGIPDVSVFLEISGSTDVFAPGTKTNGSGVVSTTFTGSTPQAVVGYIAKGTVSPVYKRQDLALTISTTGLFATIAMVSDE
jgi:hypothetical protein